MRYAPPLPSGPPLIIMQLHIPHSDDSKFEPVTQKVRYCPGVIQRHSIAPIAKVIHATPPHLGALWSRSQDEATGSFPPALGCPHGAVVARQGGVEGSALALISIGVYVDIAVLCKPRPLILLTLCLVVILTPLTGLASGVATYTGGEGKTISHTRASTKLHTNFCFYLSTIPSLIKVHLRTPKILINIS